MKITSNIIKYAEREAAKIGTLNNSVTCGDGNVAGIIGELLALKRLGLEAKHLKSSRSYEYDIIDDDGIKWEVKTKRRNVPPEPYHNCTVFDYNTKQLCDRYLFISLCNLEEGFVLGWMGKNEFYKQAKFYKKGEEDPESPPWKIFKFPADCYNIQVGDLNQL